MSSINDVSDTALWVANYRATESERPDAIFKDPLAKVLVGERGRQIAESMKFTANYVEWTVVIRTYIIDQFIEKAIAEGVDTIINLGAGLDTRPYRMKLPKSLKWIEVDYPHMMETKSEKLQNEHPACHLYRVSLDLADVEKRREVFAEFNRTTKKALIITEGVIPYLTEEQVASLSEDIRAQENFHYWITEYFQSRIYPYLKNKKRMKHMKNAPFQFFPDDCFQFFDDLGWNLKEITYTAEASVKLGREVPAPWWARILRKLSSPEKLVKYQRFSGYMVHSRN